MRVHLTKRYRSAGPSPSSRGLLSFERRVTEDERKKLARNGIEVGLFLGGTVYSARIQQTDRRACPRL